jgi:endoglucanase
MAIPDLLVRLLDAPGPSGFEAAPAAVWREAAAAYGEVTSDAVGSSVVRVKGSGDGPLLAVLGHIDEIGMIVTHIDDEGLLYFRKIGGWSAEVVVGQRAQLLTRNGSVHGVVARRQRSGKSSDKVESAEVEELHIDIGASGRDEARGLVRPGDAAVLASHPAELPNRRVVARSLDNRIGSYAALEVARLLAESPAPGDVAAVAAVQEEISGGAGASTSMYALEPDVAVVFDVTYATDVPGADPKDDGEHPLGSGAAILRGPTMNGAVFELLHETAEQEAIPFTIEVSGGTTYSDADRIHLTRAGLPTALVSIPLRYMHSPNEMVQLDDVDACARLVASFARRLERGMSFEPSAPH